MTAPSLRTWIEGRTPVPPPSLGRRLLPFLAGGREASPEGLTAGAQSALEGVLQRASSREREVAYDLLVADALLTYACEAALEEEDPAASLDALLGKVAGAGEPDR